MILTIFLRCNQWWHIYILLSCSVYSTIKCILMLKANNQGIFNIFNFCITLFSFDKSYSQFINHTDQRSSLIVFLCFCPLSLTGPCSSPQFCPWSCYCPCSLPLAIGYWPYVGPFTDYCICYSSFSIPGLCFGLISVLVCIIVLCLISP